MKQLLILFILISISCEPRVFNVSSPSMERTLETGTTVYVNFEDPTRNDIVIFEPPTYPETYWICRMVGQAGDSIRISDGEVYVNSEKQVYPPTIQYRYEVATDVLVKDRIFNDKGISEYFRTNDGYVAFTTVAVAAELGEEPFIKSVEKMIAEVEDREPLIFEDFEGNADHLGGIYIPRKGDLVKGKHIMRFKNLIEQHEGVDVNEIEGGRYIFKRDYCFLLGDNRHNALDSRYFGLVPMDDVLGVAEAL